MYILPGDEQNAAFNENNKDEAQDEEELMEEYKRAKEEYLVVSLIDNICTLLNLSLFRLGFAHSC